MTFPSSIGPSRPESGLYPKAQRSKEPRNGQRTTPFQRLVLVLFALLLVASVALTVWKIGPVPVRALIAMGLLFVIGARNFSILRASAARSRPLLLFGLALALLGTIVSAFNRTPFPTILGQLVEIHAQAAINIVLGCAVVLICGRKAVLQCILLAVGLSSLFALLQAVGFEPAWTLRGIIGTIQGEVFEKYGFFYDRRPMGLSLSPILLATQVCLAFAAVGVFYERKLRPTIEGVQTAKPGTVFENGVLISLLLFVVICFFSGNRSPILGAVIFFIVYTLLRRPKYFILALPFAVALGVWVLPQVLNLAADTGSRVLQTGDASSEGRGTLTYYGMLLLKNQPFGYGFDFDPTRYWQIYWSDLQHLPYPGTVIVYPLHNYALMMLCFYGFPLLFFLPFIWRMLWPNRALLVFFIPYIIHIAFHNTGPFWNDFMIWFVTALGTTAVAKPQSGARSARMSTPVEAARPHGPSRRSSKVSNEPTGR